MNPNFVNKANYRFNTYHPTDIVKFDKATALELKFEYIINSIIYGLNEFDKAKASQHTDKEHSRSPRMIFQEQVIGKLDEEGREDSATSIFSNIKYPVIS